MIITTKAGRRTIIDPQTANNPRPVVLGVFTEDGKLIVTRHHQFRTIISTTSDFTVYTEDGRVAYVHKQGTISSEGTV